MDFQEIYTQLFSEGYNIPNTLLLGLITVIVTLITYKILSKLKIKIDGKLAMVITPLVIFGSSLRVLEDIGFIHGQVFRTPGVYLLMVGIGLFLVLLSLLFQKKTKASYYKIPFLCGVILSTITTTVLLSKVPTRNFLGVFYLLIWYMPWLIILLFIKWSQENKIITAVQMFDATTTFVSMKYFSYLEQHILPRNLIALTGTPFSFVLLKFVVVIFVLWALDRYSDAEDKGLKNSIKLVIGILGGGPGIRDLLRLFLLV